MTSVLIIDDHPMVLQGCRRVLEDMGIERLYEATTVISGYRAFLRHHPDVVIADLTFEGDDLGGLSLIRRIASSDRKARILVLSMHNDPAIVSRALESGALSYVLKDMSSSEFSTAFEKVQLGEPHLSHRLAMQVAMLRSKGKDSATKDLTSREVQILALLGKGNNYDKIAAKLGISYKTVTNACSSIRTKLKINTLAELIRFAIYNDPERSS
jgi:two-component system, NarL family, invasion response regulator UvrY